MMKAGELIKGIYLTALVLFFITASCVKEKIDTNKVSKDINIDADIATPIGYLRLAPGKFLNDSTTVLKANADSILAMYYSDSLSTPTAGSLLSFGTQTHAVRITNQTGSPVDLSVGAYSTTVSFSFAMSSPAGSINARLDSLLVSAGEIVLHNPGGISESQVTKLTFPGIKQGSEKFSVTVGSGMTEARKSLDGFMISTESGENIVSGIINLTVPAQDKTIEPGGVLADLSIDLDIANWEMIYGYPGDISLDLPARYMNVTYSADLPEGEYYFTRPELSLVTDNYFGIPVGLGLRSISAETTASGSIALSGSGVPLYPDVFTISPAISANPLTGSRDRTVINGSNSNINDIVSSTITQINYQPFIRFSSGSSAQAGFINNDSKIDLHVTLELPLAGYSGYIMLRDTSAFDPGLLSLPDGKKVGEIVFNLYYENSFPADLEVSLFLAGPDLGITDTLFETPLVVAGAEPSSVWQADPPVNKGSVNVNISPEIIPEIKNARYIIAAARMNTKDKNREVNIFSNQSLLIKTGIIINFETNTNNF